MRSATLAAALGLVLWTGAVAADDGVQPKTRTHKVTMESMRFHPDDLTVAPGDTVVWVNEDLVPHTATSQAAGFDSKEIDDLMKSLDGDDAADEVPPVPSDPVSRSGDLWHCGAHRVLCGDCTNPVAVARLLGDSKPFLMVTDPPYGIELDSEWRDRAGLNGCGAAEASYMKTRTEGHHNTTISSDTRADWSEAFRARPKH